MRQAACAHGRGNKRARRKDKSQSASETDERVHREQGALRQSAGLWLAGPQPAAGKGGARGPPQRNDVLQLQARTSVGRIEWFNERENSSKQGTLAQSGTIDGDPLRSFWVILTHDAPCPDSCPQKIFGYDTACSKNTSRVKASIPTSQLGT